MKLSQGRGPYCFIVCIYSGMLLVEKRYSCFYIFARLERVFLWRKVNKT
ncbi:hypothetical protein C4K03_4690 [Pseudomonas synxantha]|uniref:Uncharacterized protein n=1 Tax=Pseudomonas synxantha TaxID=47883 RepID=A0A3G7UE31_9PSED|nr:hypothetical protein C4K03_4690 [Pseudomonas synxantha]